MTVQPLKQLLTSLFVVIIFTAPVIAGDLSRAIIHDMPADRVLQQLGRQVGTALSAQDSASAMAAFDGDTLKLLAIPVEWSDRPGNYSREQIDSLLFSRGVFPTGSVADYYDEISYGQVYLTGMVWTWVDAGLYSDFNWWDFELVLDQIDPFVDFSEFDGDGDGYVDAITFVRSGTGEEDTHDPNDIWSFALNYGSGGLGPYDGVLIDRWNTSPEARPARTAANPYPEAGVIELNTNRVFAHELGHNVGLPDLYDYDDKLVTSTYDTPDDANDHPLVDWCLMGYYGYAILSFGSEITSHMCGWAKKEMGWLTPIDVTADTANLMLYNVEMHKDSSLYRLPINPAEGEYFYLEYRSQTSTGMFDKVDSDFSAFFAPYLAFGSDPLGSGLLITHVHDSLLGYGNNGTPSFSNYRVIVEDAGYNPTQNYTTNPSGNVSDSAEWWYPWETRKSALWTDAVSGKERFGPDTYPSSDGYAGPSGIEVIVDSIVGERLYATAINPLFVDSDNDGIADINDNCPNVDNADQLDGDGDGVGTACDNCPDDPNADQLDSDNNGVGDVCQSCCVGITGNIDADAFDQVDIGDLTSLIDFLFLGGLQPACPAEANVDGAGDIDVGDLTYLIGHLFLNGPDPVDCVPDTP